MSQQLKVRDAIAMLSLLDQDAVLHIYDVAEGEFVPMTEADLQVVTAQTDGETIAPKLICEACAKENPDAVKEVEIVCINAQDLDAGITLPEESEGLIDDVQYVVSGTDLVGAFINEMEPEIEGHRIVNMEGLLAFNKVKAGAMEMFANGVRLLHGMVEIVQQDKALTEQKADLLEEANVVAGEQGKNVIAFPASLNAGGGEG
jgi:hypothetical protein